MQLRARLGARALLCFWRLIEGRRCCGLGMYFKANFPFFHKLAILLFSEIVIFMINWSSCHPIRSTIILVINKSDSRCAVARFCYHSVTGRTGLHSTQSYHHFLASVLHCTSLMRMIFASLARPDRRVHNEKNFPQAKFDTANYRLLALCFSLEIQ